jgi:imidazolonepropionase-like amidohydrolase
MSRVELNCRLQANRLLDGRGGGGITDGAILISDGKIVSVGPDSSVPHMEDVVRVNFGDATPMPGMIDAHMHTFGVPSTALQALPFEREPYRALRAAGELKEMLEAGFTAARCLGSSVGPDLQRAIDEGHLQGPHLVAAGDFISSTGGTWDAAPTPLSWVQARGFVVDGVESLREAVRRRVREGVRVIKLGLSKGFSGDRYHAWGDDPYRQTPPHTLDEVRAAVDEAHRNHLKVSAHCIGETAVRLALDGGVDVIEHGYAITDETRRELVSSGRIVVTTISQLYFHRAAYEAFHYPDWERAVYERHWSAMHNDFRKGLEAGVRYALGTDLIGEPTHPLRAAAKEYQFAVEWGMTPSDAIRAGTAVAAEALGIEQWTGTLEVGKAADVIVVPGDPLADIQALQSILFVMKQGVIAKGAERILRKC